MNISEYPSTALRMLDTVSYAASRRVIIRRFMIVMSRAGSRVVGIDLLHFPAGCRTRRLNQVSFLFYILACFNCIVPY